MAPTANFIASALCCFLPFAKTLITSPTSLNGNSPCVSPFLLHLITLLFLLTTSSAPSSKMFFRNTTYANTDTQSIQYNAILQSYFNIPDALPPDCFIQPTTTHEISTIISILSHSQYQLAVKAGGHMLYVGSNAIVHGVTIDLRRMRRTTLSADKKTASVEPGAKWGEVYQTLDSLGYAIPGGRASDVGVAGLTLGGGNSFFAARYGFVCDNVQNFEIVLGNGSVTNGNADENPDLFKALKGGSGKLGLVTRFDFVAFPSGPLWGGVAIYDFDDIHKSFEPFVDFTNNISEDPYGSLVTFYTHNSTTNQTLASNLHEYTGNATGHPYYSSSDSPDATSIAFFHLRQNRQTHYKYPPRGLAVRSHRRTQHSGRITQHLRPSHLQGHHGGIRRGQRYHHPASRSHLRPPTIFPRTSAIPASPASLYRPLSPARRRQHPRPGSRTRQQHSPVIHRDLDGSVQRWRSAPTERRGPGKCDGLHEKRGRVPALAIRELRLRGPGPDRQLWGCECGVFEASEWEVWSPADVSEVGARRVEVGDAGRRKKEFNFNQFESFEKMCVMKEYGQRIGCSWALERTWRNRMGIC